MRIDYSTGEILGSNPLPCLNSNNSTGTNELSTQHRKSAHILSKAVTRLAQKFGIDHLAFLTLTFADHVTDPREAQRRLNSYQTHILRHLFREYICVLERQKSGRIHYHYVVVTRGNVRKGVDFNEISKGKYSSAGAALRDLWTTLRETAPRHGFGRTELLPIKSNEEAIGKYVGKYIAKHIEQRKEEDKGVRLVRYSTGAKYGTTRFSFYSPGSIEWRKKLRIFAKLMQRARPGSRIHELSDLSAVLGKNWAYQYREMIMNLTPADLRRTPCPF